MKFDNNSRGDDIMNEIHTAAEFLNKVYENAVMGEEAVNMVSDKVEDEALIKELERQSGEYKRLAHEAHTALTAIEEEPDRQSPLSKLGLWSGIQLNTLTDRSSDKIAEIMIQGGIMGVIDITRLLKEYPSVSEEYRHTAEQLIAFQEDAIQKMKQFLG